MEEENEGGMNSIQMIGAIKIRDGLFIGDELASRVRSSPIIKLFAVHNLIWETNSDTLLGCRLPSDQ